MVLFGLLDVSSPRLMGNNAWIRLSSFCLNGFVERKTCFPVQFCPRILGSTIIQQWIKKAHGETLNGKEIVTNPDSFRQVCGLFLVGKTHRGTCLNRIVGPLRTTQPQQPFSCYVAYPSGLIAPFPLSLFPTCCYCSRPDAFCLALPLWSNLAQTSTQRVSVHRGCFASGEP